MREYCEKCDTVHSSWNVVGLIGYSIIIGILGWSLLDSNNGMFRIAILEYIPQSWFYPLIGIFLGLGFSAYSFLVIDHYLIKRNHKKESE